MITEIEIEDVGTLRQCNAWQINRIRRMQDRENRSIAWMAFGLGMSIQQFKRLPQAKQQEAWEAYKTLINSANIPRPEPSTATAARPMFRKGAHRTDEQKTAIGRGLLEVKAALPSGYFGPWLLERGIPATMAQQCMRLARKADAVADVPLVN